MPVQLKDTSAEELQHYVIQEHIGSGAAGEAFKVTDRRDRHEYVLKEMSLQSMSDEEKLRARQEIDVMNNVNHPNVVKFRESFSGVDSVDIVMEYCAGGTLEELITRQRYEGKVFPGNVILEWMAQLLCALAHIHAKGILHRDIKTGNIFVTTKNHLKLGDFGVCTLLTNKKLAEASLIGTPLYFSPEVCEQKAYDERSDVWSLGIVFYEMCTLRRPFEANNLLVLINKIISEQVAPFNTGLDLRFEEIVRDMLNKDPVKRPTAQALIDDYLEVPQRHPSHPSQKPALGRYIQQQHGPTLKYNKPWPISGDELSKYANGKIANQHKNNATNEGNSSIEEEEEVENSYNVTSEWLDTCEAIDLAVLLQTNAFAYRNETNGVMEQNNTTDTTATTADNNDKDISKEKSEKCSTSGVSNINKTEAYKDKNNTSKEHHINKNIKVNNQKDVVWKVVDNNETSERKKHNSSVIRSERVIESSITNSERNKTNSNEYNKWNSSTSTRHKTSTCIMANPKENAQLSDCKGSNNKLNVNKNNYKNDNNFKNLRSHRNTKLITSKRNTLNKLQEHERMTNVRVLTKEKCNVEEQHQSYTSSSSLCSKKLHIKENTKHENVGEVNIVKHKSTRWSDKGAVLHPESDFDNKAAKKQLHNNKEEEESNTKLVIRTSNDANNKSSKEIVQDKVKMPQIILPRSSMSLKECTTPMATSLSMTDVQENVLRTREAIFGKNSLEWSNNPSFVVELPLKQRNSSSVKSIGSALAQLSESLNLVSNNNIFCNTKNSPTTNNKNNNNCTESYHNIISFTNDNSMPSNYNSNNSLNKYKTRENSENSNDNKYSLVNERNVIPSNNNININSNFDSAMVGERVNKINNNNKCNNSNTESFANQLHTFIADYVKTHNAIELNDIIKSIALLDNYRRVNYTNKQQENKIRNHYV